MTRAAIYCRISQDQTGQGLGVTRQEQDCRELAAQLGWEVVELYVDNDISATSGKPRPAYRKLLADIEAGLVDAIVPWHPDRLYRRAAELGELVDVCKRHNTQIATVKAGAVDLTTPTGRLVAGLLAQVATYEGEAKSDRWKRSVRQRREAGDWAHSGPRMYGYTRTGEVVPDEADRLRWIASEISEGRSLSSIITELFGTKVPTSTGGTWSQAGLRKLMLNPRLAGYATLNGEIIGRGQWPQILMQEEWETVRAILLPRTRPRQARVALLAGLVRCGAEGCGAPMVTGSRTTKRKGVSRRTYRCTRVPGAGGCGKISVSAETLEDIVEKYAQIKLADPAVREELAALARTTGDRTAEIVQLEERLIELEHQLDEPGVPAGAITRAMARTGERIDRLRASVVPTPVDLKGGEWPTDLARRTRLVRLVVTDVVVLPADPGKAGTFDPRRVEINGARLVP